MAAAQRHQPHLERRAARRSYQSDQPRGSAGPVGSAGGDTGRRSQPMRTSAPRRYRGVISSSGTDGRAAASSTRTVGAGVVVDRPGQLDIREGAEGVGIAAGAVTDRQHRVASGQLGQLVDEDLGPARRDRRGGQATLTPGRQSQRARGRAGRGARRPRPAWRPRPPRPAGPAGGADGPAARATSSRRWGCRGRPPGPWRWPRRPASPVNRPGPTSTATRPTCCIPIPASRVRVSMLGASSSAWRRPWRTCKDGQRPVRARQGHPDLGGGRGDAEQYGHGTVGPGAVGRQALDRSHQIGPARLPARSRRPKGDQALAFGLGQGELDVEVLRPEGRRGPAAPFDGGDGAVFQHLRQAEVDDVGQLVEAVHVDVDQLDAERGRVAAHQGEGGAGHRLAHAHGPSQALGEGRLAGAEIAVEEQHVARQQGAGDGGGRRPWWRRGRRRRSPGWRAGAASSARVPAGARAETAASRAARARTKSARIRATTSPPPRRAAAGW